MNQDESSDCPEDESGNSEIAIAHSDFTSNNANQTPRTNHRSYTWTDMQNAIKKARETKNSVRSIAKEFGVPESSLRLKLSSKGNPEATQPGPPPVFTKEEEAKFVGYLHFLEECGYSYGRCEVVQMASEYAFDLNLRVPEEPLTKAWYATFISRWPCLSIRKLSLKLQRDKATDENYVSKYYSELQSILSKYNLEDHPERVFTIDEKRPSTANNHLSDEIGVAFQHENEDTESTNIETVTCTLIGGGNALGHVVPPFFIFPGTRMHQKFLKDGCDGVSGAVSSSGLCNSIVFRKYIENHLLRFLPERSTDNPVMILFDGHRSYIDAHLINWAKSLHLIFFILPAHTSHALLPVHNGCFGSFDRIFKQTAYNFMSKSFDSKVTKENICEIGCSSYMRAMTMESVRNFFQYSGIYPFNPDCFGPSNFWSQDEKDAIPFNVDYEIAETIKQGNVVMIQARENTNLIKKSTGNKLSKKVIDKADKKKPTGKKSPCVMKPSDEGKKIAGKKRQSTTGIDDDNIKKQTGINQLYSGHDSDQKVRRKECKNSAVNHVEIIDDLSKIQDNFTGKLSFKKGQKIDILNRTNADWWWASVDGQVGYVPVNYLGDGDDTRATAWQDEEYFSSYGNLKLHHEMLSDKVRTQAYMDAIVKNSSHIKGKTVLDIGCGTGILSMICAKQGGAAKVYAVELSEMAEHTKEVIKHNNLADRIEVIQDYAENVDLDQPVDLIVSEWMGTVLIFEMMIESVIKVRDKHLKGGGKMWPSTASLFLVPCSAHAQYNNKVGFWDSQFGFDFSCLKTLAKKDLLQKPFHDYVLLKQDCLSQEQSVLTLDINSVSVRDLEENTSEFRFPIHQGGTLHGFCMWFEVGFSPFDESFEEVKLNTGPEHPLTHWKQNLFLLDEPFKVCCGNILVGRIQIVRNPEYRRHLRVHIEYQLLENGTSSTQIVEGEKLFYVWR